MDFPGNLSQHHPIWAKFHAKALSTLPARIRNWWLLESHPRFTRSDHLQAYRRWQQAVRCRALLGLPPSRAGCRAKAEELEDGRQKLADEHRRKERQFERLHEKYRDNPYADEQEIPLDLNELQREYAEEYDRLQSAQRQIRKASRLEARLSHLRLHRLLKNLEHLRDSDVSDNYWKSIPLEMTDVLSEWQGKS